MRFGFLDSAVGPVRARDHRLRSPMGSFVPDAERDAAFRSFQFMGAIAPETAVGCAVTRVGGVLTAFAYLWAERSITELRLIAGEADDASFAADPDDGVTELVTSAGSVRMVADGSGAKQLQVDSPGLVVDLDFRDDEFDVLRLCTPTGPTGWAYVQKVAATPAAGFVRAGDVIVDLIGCDAQAHHDYTTGFLRPETWWHWACVASRLPDGRRFGLNVSCGTNESAFRENGAWLDDTWFPLDGALFEFDPDDIEGAWTIVGTDGRFELTFHPAAQYAALLDTAALATNFHQLFGRFDGWIVVGDDHVDLSDVPGFAESQYLRW